MSKIADRLTRCESSIDAKGNAEVDDDGCGDMVKVTGCGEGDVLFRSDNIRGDNYKLSFYDYAMTKHRKEITLVKFRRRPYTKIWEYDFCESEIIERGTTH